MFRFDWSFIYFVCDLDQQNSFLGLEIHKYTKSGKRVARGMLHNGIRKELIVIINKDIKYFWSRANVSWILSWGSNVICLFLWNMCDYKAHISTMLSQMLQRIIRMVDVLLDIFAQGIAFLSVLPCIFAVSFAMLWRPEELTLAVEASCP